VGIVSAFGFGMLSFLSPCVLPLIPAYLSFMTGMTSSELAEKRPSTARVLVPALLFVAGFSIVFVALGASASVIGRLLLDYRWAVEKVAGVAIVAFGVLMLGVIKVPWLYGEARVDLEKSRAFGRGASLVMGMAFAAGWTPCVGPFLGTLLTFAGASSSVGWGALLLAVYSLGLGVPFLLVALLFGRLSGLLKWIGRYSAAVNKVAGALLVLVGILVFTGRLAQLSGWLSSVIPHFGS
jgi:cytochrome c-type biogenesis protein